MKTIRCKTKFHSERGAVAILVAVLLAVFMGVAALAIDIGYMMTARNELQNAADAGALAAARKLGTLYEALSYQQQLTYVVTPADLVTVAENAVLQNKAAGTAITLAPAEVIIGNWSSASRTVSPTLTTPDAVRVTVRKDASMNGPISTFFAKIWGTNSVDAFATATAALTGESTAAAGGLPIPIGVSQVLAESSYPSEPCGKKIELHPTKDSCAGWNAFTSKADASHIDQILNDLLPKTDPVAVALRDKKYKTDPTYVSPEVKINDAPLNFKGGDIASLWPPFLTLFDYMKTRDGDGDDTVWTTAIVIYKETGTCGNPTGSLPIVGFATMIVSKVVGPPITIYGEILCNVKDAGRGGGGNYGTKGTIPGLVQ